MNSKKENPFNIFYAFCFFVQFIFLGLKLVHAIDWSWWWVCTPLLVAAGITHIMIFFCGLYYIYGGKEKHDPPKT
jgi:uncharacterized membrane protein YhaH (DUF805 family)